MANLLLASASPRRQELLKQIGVRYISQPMDIDETPYDGELADEYVGRLAIEKAKAGITLHSNLAVLAADTSVVIDGKILGKPSNPEDAKDMLKALSGRNHQVLTGVALARNVKGALELISEVVVTQVHFSELSSEVIDQYVATGESFDKAGGYGIQGRAAVFVDKISGCYSNVVGLPLAQVGSMLQRFNIPIWQD